MDRVKILKARLLTLRSSKEWNSVAEDSMTHKVRRSKRVSKKRAYDDEWLTEENTIKKCRLNKAKKRKVQLSNRVTLCNNSGIKNIGKSLKKKIVVNTVIKKQDDAIPKSEDNGVLLRSLDNNDLQTIHNPLIDEYRLRSPVIDDINKLQDNIRIDDPSTSGQDEVKTPESYTNYFYPSPKNFDDVSEILQMIWDRQQSEERNNNV